MISKSIIIGTSKNVYRRFLEDIKKDLPTHIFILTYGLWCGIGSDGYCKYTTNTYHLLNWLNYYGDRCKTTVVVGYNNDSVSNIIFQTAKNFKHIKFVAVKEMHSKCILTSSGIVCVGSSNLNDSSWDEINCYSTIPVDSDNFSELHAIITALCEKGTVIGCDTNAGTS